MLQIAYEAVREIDFNQKQLIFDGEVELTVDDQDYKRELADMRKCEIKEWLAKIHQTGITNKGEYQRRLNLLQEEEFNGALLNTEKYLKLKTNLGLFDGEVALFSHTAEQAQGSTAIHQELFYKHQLNPSASE